MLLGASATALLQGVSNLLAFGLSVLLARLLGAGGYGRYALAVAWSGLLVVPAILGFDRFLVRGLAVYEVDSEWGLMKGLLRRTNELVLAVSVTIAACGALLAWKFASSSIRGPFLAGMLLIPLTALTLLRQSSMQAFGRVVRGQLPEYLIRPVLILLGVLALALTGAHALTPTTALLANVAGVAVAFLLGIVLLAKALPGPVRSVKPQFQTRSWLISALPMMLIGGAWLANNYIATLTVGTFDGARVAGVYSVVQRGAELIVILLVAANMPLAPALARLHARGDRAGLEHVTEKMARATLLVSAPLALILMLAPELYLQIFGPGFRTGATALSILAAAQLVNAACGPCGNVLIMTGHERTAVIGVAAGVALNLLLAAILVPLLGVSGGALAFAASLIVWNAILVVLARRLLGVNVTAFRRLSMRRTPAPVCEGA
jgi:O-antigen/teichoic acid export membrane protein